MGTVPEWIMAIIGIINLIILVSVIRSKNKTIADYKKLIKATIVATLAANLGTNPNAFDHFRNHMKDNDIDDIINKMSSVDNK